MAGVGVKPQQQAESHKYMAKGQTDFSFGYKSMWVLAPERDGAHNWEGVGLQTALASLGALRALAARTDAPARADRIHVTSHSRGGHGALMVGLSQPDRCMSVSSAAATGRTSRAAAASMLVLVAGGSVDCSCKACG